MRYQHNHVSVLQRPRHHASHTLAIVGCACDATIAPAAQRTLAASALVDF